MQRTQAHSWTEDGEVWTISEDEHEVEVRHVDGTLPGYVLPLPVRQELLRLAEIMEAARGFEISREQEEFDYLQRLLHRYEERRESAPDGPKPDHESIYDRSERLSARYTREDGSRR